MATRTIRARKGDTITEIERLVAERDESKAARRSQRIKAAKRDGRRALCARDAAQEAGVAAELRAGTALCRLVDQGLSIGDAAVLLDVSRNAAKRLLRIATEATAAAAPVPSTQARDGCDVAAAGAHGPHLRRRAAPASTSESSDQETGCLPNRTGRGPRDFAGECP